MTPRTHWWLQAGVCTMAGVVAVSVIFDGSLMRAFQPEVAKILEPATTPPTAIATWWDLARTLITLAALVLLAIMTLRSRAATIYKDELEAQRVRGDRLADDLRSRSAELSALRAQHDLDLKTLHQQIEILTAKTDLTTVIETMRTSGESQQKFNALLADSVKGLATQSDERYTRGMDYMKEMMMALVGAQGTNTKHIEIVLEIVRAIQKSLDATAAATRQATQAARAATKGEPDGREGED
jgi:hypothetical protein